MACLPTMGVIGTLWYTPSSVKQFTMKSVSLLSQAAMNCLTKRSLFWAASENVMPSTFEPFELTAGVVVELLPGDQALAISVHHHICRSKPGVGGVPIEVDLGVGG